MATPFVFFIKRRATTTGLPIARVACEWAISNQSILTEQEIKDTFDELKIKIPDSLRYIEIMPSSGYENPEEEAKKLSADEIYSLRTRGYHRDVRNVQAQTSPPPATPTSSDESKAVVIGGDPYNNVLSDRLNCDQRYDNIIRRNKLMGQAELNKDLQSAIRKVGKKTAEKVVSSRDSIEKSNSEVAKQLLNTFDNFIAKGDTK